jgi:hypothetical protein
MKMKIALIKVGQVEYFANYNKILKWKSEIFNVGTIQRVEYAPESDVNDCFLDNKYTQKGLKEHVTCPSDYDLAIAITSYRFDDNFYIHRLSNNCAVLSLYGISEILNQAGISMENFILKQIYEVCALMSLVTDVSSSEVYNFVHLDTRGCLFDMNGDRRDILRNTEQPTICTSCKSKFGSKQLEQKFLVTLEKELMKLKKPLLQRIENCIKKYPLLSILTTTLIAIFINLVSNLIFNLLKISNF